MPPLNPEQNCKGFPLLTKSCHCVPRFRRYNLSNLIILHVSCNYDDATCCHGYRHGQLEAKHSHAQPAQMKVISAQLDKIYHMTMHTMSCPQSILTQITFDRLLWSSTRCPRQNAFNKQHVDTKRCRKARAFYRCQHHVCRATSCEDMASQSSIIGPVLCPGKGSFPIQ